MRAFKKVLVLSIVLLNCYDYLLAASDSDQNKIAIVIGINQYLNLTKLRAAVNDATDMKNMLQDTGFKVYSLSDNAGNINKRPSVSALEKIKINIENRAKIRPVDKLVFFFSGHGVAINGANYLAFPEADIKQKYGLINLDADIIPWLRTLKANQIMVFVDACRENITLSRSTSVRGISVIKKKKKKKHGMFIMYAASPGGYSLEKPDGSNGYFTEYLIRSIQQKDHSRLRELSMAMRQDLPEVTERETGYAQIPYVGGDYDPSAKFTISNTKKTSISKPTKVLAQKSYRPRNRYDGAIWRGFLFPGWGHLYSRNNRGYFYGTTFLATSLYFVIAHFDYSAARTSYQNAVSDFDTKYNTMNNKKKIRGYVSYALVAIYTISLADILFTSLSLNSMSQALPSLGRWRLTADTIEYQDSLNQTRNYNSNLSLTMKF